MSETEYIELEYVIADNQITPVQDIDSCCLNEEQAMSVREAFSKIRVGFSYDKTWGFSKIVCVNGVSV